jgi:O-antigen ligase
MSHTAITTENQPISRWVMFFIILLPFLVLGSRITSDLSATICTLFLLFFWFKNPKSEVRKQAWFNTYLILWLFMCVTSIFTTNPKYIIVQSLIDIRWPTFALVLSCLVFTNESRLRLFEKSALILFVFIALDSILQYCTGQDIFGHVQTDSVRLTGPFSKLVPGIYSLRIYPIAVLAFFMIASRLSKYKFLGCFIALVCFSQTFAFLTGERIVFLSYGLFNSILLLAVIRYEKLSYRFVLGSLSIFASIAFASILLAPKMFNRTILSFIYQMQHFEAGPSYSTMINALTMLKSSPWIGVGTRYYHFACMEMPISLQPSQAVGGCLIHPHQIYLEVLAQNGLIGFMLFLIVLFFIFKKVFQGLDFKNNFLLSTIVATPLCMIFSPIAPSMSIQTNNYAGLVWMVVGWILARAMVSSKSKSAQIPNPHH